MEPTETILHAFRSALLTEETLGIVQVDAVLCEDGETILLYGHTADDNVTYTASFKIPPVTWRKA